MKNNLILTLSFLMSAFLFNPVQSNAQAVGEGNFMIQAHYGFPNLFTATVKTTYANSGTATNITTSGLGPVAFRADYMFAEQFGVGLEVTYATSAVSYTDSGFTYEISVPRIRVLPRFTWHFVTNDFVDFYATIGGGYKQTTYKFTTNDPDYDQSSISGLIPVSTRLGLGFNYYIANVIGIGLEMGIGGPLVSGGITIKV